MKDDIDLELDRYPFNDSERRVIRDVVEDARRAGVPASVSMVARVMEAGKKYGAEGGMVEAAEDNGRAQLRSDTMNPIYAIWSDEFKEYAGGTAAGKRYLDTFETEREAETYLEGMKTIADSRVVRLVPEMNYIGARR